MDTSILTTLTTDELRDLVKQAAAEALDESRAAKWARVPEILSAEEACKLTGFSIYTLYRKTSRKEIPHFKRGRKLFFRRDELIAWIMEGKVDHTT